MDGRPYVSMSEVVTATRNNKSTRPIQSWLDTATKPSGANGSQGLHQGFDTATPIDAVVPVDNGRTTTAAKLLSPQLAARFWMSELSNRSEAVVKRALKLVTLLADVALNDLCQEALGMRITPEENLHGAIRLQADLEKKAPDIQRLKLAIYQVARKGSV